MLLRACSSGDNIDGGTSGAAQQQEEGPCSASMRTSIHVTRCQHLALAAHRHSTQMHAGQVLPRQHRSIRSGRVEVHLPTNLPRHLPTRHTCHLLNAHAALHKPTSSPTAHNCTPIRLSTRSPPHLRVLAKRALNLLVEVRVALVDVVDVGVVPEAPPPPVLVGRLLAASRVVEVG